MLTDTISAHAAPSATISSPLLYFTHKEVLRKVLRQSLTNFRPKQRRAKLLSEIISWLTLPAAAARSHIQLRSQAFNDFPVFDLTATILLVY